MKHPVTVITSQDIPILGVSLNKSEFKLPKIKHQFSIHKEQLTNKKSTIIEIQFTKEASYNQLKFDFYIKHINNINIFFSHDNIFWFRISIRSITNKESFTTLRLPLIRSKYLQIVISDIEILNSLSGSISKSVDIHFESSSNKDRLWVPENLIDKREDYGWSPNTKQQSQDEFVMLDLGDTYYIHDISLRATKVGLTNFPKNFLIELSKDKNNWDTVVREENFSAAPLSWYRWSDLLSHVRYIKIKIIEINIKKQPFYEILKLDIFAIPDNEITEWGKNSNHQCEASEIRPGPVRFAELNSVHPLRAVQANDPRLKHGTTTRPGIFRIAKDNESTPMIALQSNDSRITSATEQKEGIIRLAKDKESIQGAALQSNDSRLRISNTKFPGIIQLAENKSVNPGYAVQSNDDRLRFASTTWSGIIQLAKHGEIHQDKVILSDDPRLLEANEETKGRVRFARDKGNEPFTAVQGNDSRLTLCTNKKMGLVKFANLNQKKEFLAVQSNDPRLENARASLPHQHDYASKNHILNSHEGALNLTITKKIKNNFKYNLIDLQSFPLSVQNKEGMSAAFQGGVVIEGNEEPALHTFSKTNVALKAKSKNKPAGIFFSEKDFSLHLPAKLDELMGSSKSILAEGDAVFRRNISFENGLFIAISWSIFSDELFVDGDLLTIQDNSICKLKSNHQPFIGVFIKEPPFYLSQTAEQESVVKIAILGVINIRVKGKINSGDWIGYLDDEPGIARQINPVQKQHGFAVAMESSGKETEKLIPCLLKR